MVQPVVTWLANVSSADGANVNGALGGVGDSGSSWLVIDTAADKITFLDAVQESGDLLTGPKNVFTITSTASEVPKLFIEDLSAGTYVRVPLAGTVDGGGQGGNTRYVLALFFDNVTSTVPYLEAWDNTSHDTIVSPFLGAGTATDSMIRAVATTNSAPGSTIWAGTPLAGTGSRIALDAGPLTGAKNLYFNIKMTVPANYPTTLSGSPVLSVRYSWA